MSHENVEIVRSLYDALNRRDWEAVFRNAPDFELTLLRGPAGSIEDHVVAFVTIRARIKGGSREPTPRIGHHWRVREGTLSMTSFPRAEDAPEAAGLRG